jgi:hypothetical protein
VQAIFRDLAIQAGLRGPHGRGPRLHDLRATFAVTRLLHWYRDGGDVMARLPLLSTYLGHASVSDTEVYLKITTALLQEANTFAVACTLRGYAFTGPKSRRELGPEVRLVYCQTYDIRPYVIRSYA